MPLGSDSDPAWEDTDGPTGSSRAAGEPVVPTRVKEHLRSTEPAPGHGPQVDEGATTVAVTAPGRLEEAPSTTKGIRTVGPYLLVERLGCGSQGEVWRALQTSPIHRTVALKVLWHHLPLTGEAAERMRKEAERGGRLNHETILPVLNFGLEGDSVYIAMPLVEGFTLAQVIATRRAWLADQAPADLPRLAILPEAAYLKAMARLLERVARALAHAHGERIVHRDIKPSNILVDRADDRRVFLADFGLARDLDDLTTDVRCEPGTLLYMSPERLRGQGKYDENRADIFSMGATLYEAAMLKRSFQVPADLPRSSWPSYLVGRPAPSPRKLNPHLPRDFSAVIEKAMDPSPSRRYDSASALADDLDNFCEGRPVKARPPGPLRRACRWLVARRALVVALALATALVVAGILALLAHQINRARARSDFAEARAFVQRGQLLEAYAAFERGLRRSPEEPEVAGIREGLANALRVRALELAEGDEVEPVAEFLGLYRRVSGTDPSPMDPLTRRIGLKTLELDADRPGTTFRVHPIRPDGRPRLDRLLYEGAGGSPASPLALPDIVPGRYWVTAIAPDGIAFDERPILVPPARDDLVDRSFRASLSPRPGPPAGMVRVEGGEFRMGRDPSPAPDGGPILLQPEMPASEVVLPDFDLDAAEVTNAEFAEFLEAAGRQDWASEVWPDRGHHPAGRERWPVTDVKYEQALAYAARRGCRLPTEHELEFVARAGDRAGRTSPPGLAGDPSATGPSRLDLHAVDADPRDVSFQDSRAIHGLLGNAGELTLLFYRPYPSVISLRVRDDAWNGIVVRSGLISGGKILPTAPILLGTMGRASQLPNQASVHVGFRCARSVRPWTETGPPHFKIQE